MRTEVIQVLNAHTLDNKFNTYPQWLLLKLAMQGAVAALASARILKQPNVANCSKYDRPARVI